MSEIPKGNDPSPEQVVDLSTFMISRILAENSQKKTICALGSFAGKDGEGIVFLEKLPFNEEVTKALCTKKTSLEKIFVNDIYGSYFCFPDIKLNGIKTTIIYPATELHIAKYEQKPRHIINETPELYKNITLPYILEQQLNLQWLYNILEHKKETERIIFEDTDNENGFILLPDLKWDGKQKETLYLLAIVQKHNIKSIRDLTADHLPLLRNIYHQGTKVIFEKFGLPESQLRIYFHYQPSFYHLHIHFTYLQFEAPGIYTEKAHLLINAINNIELKSDYYQMVTLPFVVNESQTLFSAYKERGLLNHLSSSEENKNE